MYLHRLHPRPRLHVRERDGAGRLRVLHSAQPVRDTYLEVLIYHVLSSLERRSNDVKYSNWLQCLKLHVIQTVMESYCIVKKNLLFAKSLSLMSVLSAKRCKIIALNWSQEFFFFKNTEMYPKVKSWIWYKNCTWKSHRQHRE
jgi:hypothetical protein